MECGREAEESAGKGRILGCLTRIVDELYPSGKINLSKFGRIIIHQ
jgi:hypothetical protein